MDTNGNRDDHGNRDGTNNDGNGNGTCDGNGDGDGDSDGKGDGDSKGDGNRSLQNCLLAQMHKCTNANTKIAHSWVTHSATKMLKKRHPRIHMGSSRTVALH